MPTAGYDAPPWRDPYTCGHGTPYDKPSPLRIMKNNNNVNRDIREAKSHPRHHGVKHAQTVQGSETLTVAKRRKFDTGRVIAQKENLRMSQFDQDLDSEGDQLPPETKAWVQYDSLPQRLGGTPLPQLSVTKTRQAHGHSKTQAGPTCALSSLSDTLPVGYGLRRPVKSRPPLSNICDDATLPRGKLPLGFHVTGREEGPFQPSGRYSPASTESFVSSQQPRPACLLAPQVTITPEVCALETGCHVLWAAIEVSTRPWLIPKRRNQPGAHWERPDLFMDVSELPEYNQQNPVEPDGLYDLSIQVLPTEKSSIIRILQNQSFPKSHLHPGSSVLLLAQIQIHVEMNGQREKKGPCRNNSDDLIEALEMELGDSDVRYMAVRLSYRHSAFPTSSDIGIANDEMFSMNNKIETVATASGVEDAQEVSRHIEASRYAQLEAKQPTRSLWLRLKEPVPWIQMQPPLDQSQTPVIPLRHASLQRSHDGEKDDGTAVFYRSQEETRRGSSRCGSTTSTCISRQSQGVPLALGTIKDAGADQHPPGQSQEAAASRREVQSPTTPDRRTYSGSSVSSTLWKRRSLGAETLKGLFPLMAGLSMTGDQGTKGEPLREDELGEMSPTRTKSKKDASRWGWASWF
ncbi:hypothetical protein F66182_6981 [Fusarium sp. NRRL 66182]|nr:hypothetical protein F66182_6981 [Fusarium sp. NRRL 66182]